MFGESERFSEDIESSLKGVYSQLLMNILIYYKVDFP